MPFLTFRKRTASAQPPASAAVQGRFAQGLRTVADLIAPAAVEVARDHLRLDAEYARTLAVTGYPRTVGLGWLAPLLDLGMPLDLSFHITPLETSEMMTALSHKLVQFHSSRMFDERSGRLADPERETALDDVERLRDALQKGVERVFSVSFYLLLRAGSPATLAALTRRVEATLAALLAHSRVAVLEQDTGFRSCLPLGQDELLVYRNLDTSSLATLFPFTSSTLTMPRGLLYGIAAKSQAPVLIDPFDERLENANTAVFATSGAGKSYFTKLLALRSLLAGVDCLVLDPEDEYGALCAAVEGQHIRLASTSPQRLNPFDLPPSAGRAVREEGERDPLAEQVAALLGLLDVMLGEPGRPLNAFERALLDQALYQTYAAAGITPDPATHALPAPLLGDLLTMLDRAAGDIAPGLAVRLRRYVDGSLAGLFSGPTNVALDRRCVVFNLQGLEPELRPLGIHLITSFVWRQVRRSRRPRLLIIDEAWSLLQYAEGGAFLAGMARRARKYYLGLVTITQDVADFLGSEHGRTVLGNAAMKLLLKQDGATIGPVAEAFRLSPEERQVLLGAGKGEGLFFARGNRLRLQVEASPAEHRLATTAPRELEAQAGAAGHEQTTSTDDRGDGSGELQGRFALPQEGGSA